MGTLRRILDLSADDRARAARMATCFQEARQARKLGHKLGPDSDTGWVFLELAADREREGRRLADLLGLMEHGQ